MGSPIANQRAVVLMSLIASCKQNRVEPWAYLKDIFTRLPNWPANQSLDELLPQRLARRKP